jgi:hypothetical protein
VRATWTQPLLDVRVLCEAAGRLPKPRWVPVSNERGHGDFVRGVGELSRVDGASWKGRVVSVDAKRLVRYRAAELKELQDHHGLRIDATSRRLFGCSRTPRAFLEIDHELTVVSGSGQVSLKPLAKWKHSASVPAYELLRDVPVFICKTAARYRGMGKVVAEAYLNATSRSLPPPKGSRVLACQPVAVTSSSGQIIDGEPVARLSVIRAKSGWAFSDGTSHEREGAELQLYKDGGMSVWHVQTDNTELAESLHRNIARQHVERELLINIIKWLSGRPNGLDAAAVEHTLSEVSGLLNRETAFGVETGVLSRLDPIAITLSVAEMEALRNEIDFIRRDIRQRVNRALGGTRYTVMGDIVGENKISGSVVGNFSSKNSGTSTQIGGIVLGELTNLFQAARDEVAGTPALADLEALEAEVQVGQDPTRIKTLCGKLLAAAPAATAVVALVSKLLELLGA